MKQHNFVRFVLTLTSLLFIGNHLSIAVLPPYLHICQRNESNMVACINNSVNHLKPKLKTGIPELDVPPLEPLHLQVIKLRRGPTGAAINANITDLKVWGAANFFVTDLKPNLQNNSFHFKVWLPHLHFKGNYDLDIKILLINIQGNGPFQGNFTDYRSEILMQGKIITKEDVEYITFGKPKLRLDIGKADIKLFNLFENDLQLRQIFDEVLNENSDVFINEIKPALEKSLSRKFGDIANKIASKFSYRELFP